MIFGKKIKELRLEQEMVQRQLAAALEIDTPMFSKIERGARPAKRSQVTILANMLHTDEEELLTIWLADKMLSVSEKEESELKQKALNVALSTLKSER